ncbi:hypothetical protein [Dickeya dadantii]|uniref:hypothetical protein n=1 Tax=Dickeya dadantii TaxID=204038 RepID=UPI001495F3FA|nr:hypothetical protein [Dickeya dadantii]NPE50279.1 hypothetical protein [Dickeya dadantii]
MTYNKIIVQRRNLTLNVKVKFVPNDRSGDSAHDYRIQTATIYARLIEDDDGTYNLIWSRSKATV